MDSEFSILVINPGSTSDEISLFHGDEEIVHKTVRYSHTDLEPFDSKPVSDQFEFRARLVINFLRESNFDLNKLDAIIGRGGLLHPIPSGTYEVNEDVLEDLLGGHYGEHPSNLGGIIANFIAKKLDLPAYIADPVVVDELEPLARFSGMPENPRLSIFHALNQKRVARLAARNLGKPYTQCNFIVMHGGGGITIGAHKKGRVVDVNNGLDGDGPFTPQRSGAVPAGGLMRMCFSRQYPINELKLKLKGHGGLMAYLGTSDLILLEKFLRGETLTDEERYSMKRGITPEYTIQCLEAMCYSISKEICASLAVFSGKVDAIVLTGGIIYDERILKWIRDRIEWAAPVLTYPGGDEMRALRDAALRVLSGRVKAKIYSSEYSYEH